MTGEERDSRRKSAELVQIFTTFLSVGFGFAGAMYLDWSTNQVVTVLVIGSVLIVIAGLVRSAVSLDQLREDIHNWLEDFRELSPGESVWFVNSNKLDRQRFLKYLSRSNIPYSISGRSKSGIRIIREFGDDIR